MQINEPVVVMPKSPVADAVVDWDRVTDGNYTACLKGLRYFTSHERNNDLLKGRHDRLSTYGILGDTIDTLQALHNLALGYVNFHTSALDPSNISTARVVKTFSELSLSQVGRELLNVMDIACLARVVVWMYRAVAEDTIRIFGFGLMSSSSEGLSSIQALNQVVAQAASGYKIIKMVLSARTTGALWQNRAAGVQIAVQALDTMVRVLEASKVVLDACESVGIPASTLAADGLSYCGFTVQNLMPSIGWTSAVMALSISLAGYTLSDLSKR